MQFVAESIIRATPERVFAFHQLPDALARLTPPWEHSRVVRNPPSLQPGARAIVEIRVAPLVWIRTESVHTLYDPPHLFADEQTRGPFRVWRHRHTIAARPEGTLLTDTIELEPPLGILGRTFAPLFILPRLRKLFAYRHEVTRAWCEADGRG